MFTLCRIIQKTFSFEFVDDKCQVIGAQKKTEFYTRDNKLQANYLFFDCVVFNRTNPIALLGQNVCLRFRRSDGYVIWTVRLRNGSQCRNYPPGVVQTLRPLSATIKEARVCPRVGLHWCPYWFVTFVSEIVSFSPESSRNGACVRPTEN